MLKKHYKNPLFDILNLSNYTVQNNPYTSVNKDKNNFIRLTNSSPTK